MIGVILAAGQGSRLGRQCKPLTRVNNRLLIQAPLDHLVALGCDNIIIVISDFLIPNALGEEHKGCPLAYINQREPGGTAHALQSARSLIDGPFYLTYGDLFLSSELAPTFPPSDDANTGFVLTSKLSPSQVKRYAAVYTNSEGFVDRIEEKPLTPSTNLGEVGFFRFPRSILDLPLIPSARGEYELQSLENELIRQGTPLYSVPFEGEWVNVNTPEDLARAQELASRSTFGLKTKRSRAL